MTALETFLEILKFTIPGLIVMLTAYLIIRTYLVKKYETKYLQLKINNREHILPLKLKSYERLALFLERINPDSLIHRTRKADMNSKDLQIAMISNIRAEFEHNLSQQIYVSSQTWTMVKAAKEEIISMISRVGSELPPNASGVDFSRAMFNVMISSNEILPTQKALGFIREEMSYLYG